MKNKILKSILLIFVVLIFKLILDYITYIVSQEYVAVAADQLNDSSAYVKIKTQQTVSYIINCIYVLTLFVSIYITYKIWK